MIGINALEVLLVDSRDHDHGEFFAGTVDSDSDSDSDFISDVGRLISQGRTLNIQTGGCTLTLTRLGFFGAPVAREHIVPPWKLCSSSTNTLLFSFLKACPKLDHVIDFGFHSNRFKCFTVAQKYFSTKTSNQMNCTNRKRFWYLMKVQILK